MTTIPLTTEQRLFSTHASGAFVEACPGAGKTRAVVARVSQIASTLPPRKGLAVISFTNTAIDEFIARCHASGLNGALRHPSFVGTFDSFLRHFFIVPCGLVGVAEPPTVVDSWDTLGIEVRLQGRDAFRGSGVPLDKFDADTNVIAPQTIGHAGLRTHVATHQEAYERAAAQWRRSLRGRGYLSAADGRVEVLRRLQAHDWASALGGALAGRFQEIIVDEAQDCNPLDLQIMTWLREHGIAVTVVADPDQAIYGFRHGDPARLLAFGAAYGTNNRLRLTGNFRSSPSICALAATLRGRSDLDDSLGDTASIDIPVQIVLFQGSSIPETIGSRFARLVQANGILSENAIILAHGRRVARQASGLSSTSDAGGDSKVAHIARAMGSLWTSSGSNSAREGALRTVERMVLDMMGRIEDSEAPSRAAEQHGINRRWLRRTALEIISRLPRSCEDTDEARVRWVTILQEEVRRHGFPYRRGTSERRYFGNPRNSEWIAQLRGLDYQEVRCATIHEAKGREYDGVCVVIPPDRSGVGVGNTARLFEAWERRTEDEAKRVVYVGITRARKLIALAVPSAFRDRVIAILDGSGVAFTLHE